jgi:hypothetical protein
MTATAKNKPHIDVELISSNLKEELSALNNHALYKSINSTEELRAFMRWHVFAVWDFMSLLKALQINLTCIQLPWTPPLDNVSARLINDIVLNEETDLNQEGLSSSHLELYLDSMSDIGADKSNFNSFMESLSNGNSVSISLDKAEVPQFVRDFVLYNIYTAEFGSILEIASSFVFGRESVIPSMFEELLKNWGIKHNDAPRLHYYLSRHIEVDTNEHGPAAEMLLDSLIDNNSDNRHKALESGREAIIKRLEFWDGIKNIIDFQKKRAT